MAQHALQHRVLDFDLEPWRGANAADRAKRAAKHHRPDRQPALAGMSGDQRLRRQYARQRSFLVQHRFAAGVARDARADHQLVPMIGDLAAIPQCVPDNLGAGLLGHRHRDGFEFAIGVVRTDPEPQAVAHGKQYRLDFAG